MCEPFGDMTKSNEVVANVTARLLAGLDALDAKKAQEKKEAEAGD